MLPADAATNTRTSIDLLLVSCLIINLLYIVLSLIELYTTATRTSRYGTVTATRSNARSSSYIYIYAAETDVAWPMIPNQLSSSSNMLIDRSIEPESTNLVVEYIYGDVIHHLEYHLDLPIQPTDRARHAPVRPTCERLGPTWPRLRGSSSTHVRNRAASLLSPVLPQPSRLPLVSLRQSRVLPLAPPRTSTQSFYKMT
jgi:hypothetical protein